MGREFRIGVWALEGSNDERSKATQYPAAQRRLRLGGYHSRGPRSTFSPEALVSEPTRTPPFLPFVWTPPCNWLTLLHPAAVAAANGDVSPFLTYTANIDRLVKGQVG